MGAGLGDFLLPVQAQHREKEHQQREGKDTDAEGEAEDVGQARDDEAGRARSAASTTP
jgi:hypothetical protein